MISELVLTGYFKIITERKYALATTQQTEVVILHRGILTVI